MANTTATCTKKDDGYFEYYQRSGCGHAVRVETQYLGLRDKRQQVATALAAQLAKPCPTCMRRNHRLTALAERASARGCEAEGDTMWFWLARADAYLCAAVAVAR